MLDSVVQVHRSLRIKRERDRLLNHFRLNPASSISDVKGGRRCLGASGGRSISNTVDQVPKGIYRAGEVGKRRGAGGEGDRVHALRYGIAATSTWRYCTYVYYSVI